MAKRKQIFTYSDEYLKLGFTSIEVNGEVRPQCVLCLTVLAHSSLNEAKLRRHLESNHGNFVNKSLEVFKEKEHQVKRSRIDRPNAWGGIIYSHSHAVRASFAVAWKIARAKAPHTAGENLIKPASVEMARIMCGDAVANKLKMVPLSNDTMKRRITELSRNVLQQTIVAIKRCERFSLQLDETTDIGSDAQLMVFVRYFDTNDFVEQFLFCRPLAKNTTGEEIFKKVDFFFEEHQLEWSNCVSVSADGAPAMMGSKKGFMSFVKKKNNNISVVHCLLHRENLATKEIQENLAIVFKEVVSVVNHIKSRPLNTRLFRALCDEMGAELSGLLFHSTVRWLSRGKVLERVVTLRDETQAFLKEQKHELVDRFRNDEWIAKLLFLADVFSHVNQLNSSMQGKEKLFFDVLESIDALKGKIKLWIHRMKSRRLAAFPGLNLFVEENDINLGVILPIFLEHLSTLLSELDRYIPSNDYCRIFNWVGNPFQASALEVHSDMDCIAEQLLELQSRQMWKDKFKNASLTQFWANVQSMEPSLSDLCKQAATALLPFPTTYLCESGFSTLTMIKTKYRNRLQPEDDIRCALATIIPEFDKLVKQVQGQGSH